MLSAPVRPADAGLEQLPSGLRRTSQRPPPVWTLEPAPRVSVLGCRNQVPQNGVCACGGGAGGGLIAPWFQRPEGRSQGIPPTSSPHVGFASCSFRGQPAAPGSGAHPSALCLSPQGRLAHVCVSSW